MSSVETGQMSAVETGQMSAAETGQMSAVETRQMYSIETGQARGHSKVVHSALPLRSKPNLSGLGKAFARPYL